MRKERLRLEVAWICVEGRGRKVRRAKNFSVDGVL
jgi:hypothetical protein